MKLCTCSCSLQYCDASDIGGRSGYSTWFWFVRVSHSDWALHFLPRDARSASAALLS